MGDREGACGPFFHARVLAGRSKNLRTCSSRSRRAGHAAAGALDSGNAPYALPTFFLSGYPSVARACAILVGLVYAVIAFVQLPVSLLGMVAPWIGVPELTLVLSVLALKRYGRVLVVALLGAQDPR
ncbi:hypothetical protein [Acidovorax sp. Root217]|uniref:hypothetical protein n=1 Tax=Acidovorax sp. Root217 TaxID=1736492 RepID=UPI0012F92F43|nr:hypothetical protein [Acidovorax sp. Root217]